MNIYKTFEITIGKHNEIGCIDDKFYREAVSMWLTGWLLFFFIYSTSGPLKSIVFLINS